MIFRYKMPLYTSSLNEASLTTCTYVLHEFCHVFSGASRKKKNHVSNPKRQAEVGNRVIFHFASEAMNQTRPEYVFMRVFVWFSFRGQKSFYVYRSLWDFSFAKTGEAGVVQKNNFFSIISNVRSSVLIHSNYGQVFFLGKTLTCRRNLALYVFLWFLLRTLFGRTWSLFSVGYFFFLPFFTIFRSVRKISYLFFVRLSFASSRHNTFWIRNAFSNLTRIRLRIYEKWFFNANVCFEIDA